MSFEINDRVKELRTSMMLSQTDFCNSLEIKQGTLSDIERKKINVSHKTVEKLVQKFQISKEWLYTGNGYVFTDKTLNEKYFKNKIGQTAQNVINIPIEETYEARVKVVSFWKKLLDEDKEINKTITALNELEGLKMDLGVYIQRLNTIINNIDSEALKADNKTITTSKYIKDAIKKLAFLKDHYHNISELNSSIESVLGFIDHDSTAEIL